MEKKWPGDICDYMKGYGEKRNYPQTKTGKKFSVKLLCDRYVYSFHMDKTFFLLRSFESLPLTDLRRDVRQDIQAYSEKGVIFR